MADLLLAIVRTDDEPEQVRAKAAISLGPVLEEAAEPPITEKTFHRIQQTLRDIHIGHRVPKELRRRVPEASVRAPQDWHPEARSSACGGFVVSITRSSRCKEPESGHSLRGGSCGRQLGVGCGLAARCCAHRFRDRQASAPATLGRRQVLPCRGRVRKPAHPGHDGERALDTSVAAHAFVLPPGGREPRPDQESGTGRLDHCALP